MDSAHREDLKRNELEEALGKGIHYAEDHKRMILYGVGGVLGAALVAAGIFYWIGSRKDGANELLGKALVVDGGAVVATGSPRRRAQLLDAFPHLTIVELRGNIATRLSKVGSPAAGAPDGATVSSVIVAAAALDRLEQSHLAVEYLDPTRFIPQVGRGIVAVECRRDDDELVTLLGQINDPISQRCAVAERAFLAELGGDCRLPAAAHASVTASGTLLLRAMLTSGDGGPVETVRSEGDDPAALGTQAAQELLRRMP